MIRSGVSARCKLPCWGACDGSPAPQCIDFFGTVRDRGGCTNSIPAELIGAGRFPPASPSATAALIVKPGGLGLSVDATTTLQHTLIAKNSVGVTAIDCAGIFTSAGHNLIGSGCGSSLGGSDLAGVDPKLEMLNLNGSETSTVGLGADNPALNAGGSTVGVDQRGVARDGAADIGAFERVVVTVTPTPTVTPQPTASPTPTPTATPGVPNTGETERVYLPLVVR